MEKAMRKYPVVVALVALVIGLVGIRIPVGESVWADTGVRVVLSGIMMFIMVVMAGGKEPLALTSDGFGFTMKKSLYLLILDLILGIGVVVSQLGLGIQERWPISMIEYFIFFMSVGVFEEALFRGVLLHGYLKAMEKNRNGVVYAVLLSSVIFGVVHVLSYLLGGTYDSNGLLQSLLKTVQTGIFGMLMAAIYLKTKNFWAIALVHGLNDFLEALSIPLSGSGKLGEYVSTGDQGPVIIFVYLATLVLYIPMIISSIKMIKSTKVPEQGICA